MDKLVIIDGLEDFIVVDKDNVLLIYPKSKEQEIPLPKGCFGGPKSELGALVSLVELLTVEKKRK